MNVEWLKTALDAIGVTSKVKAFTDIQTPLQSMVSGDWIKPVGLVYADPIAANQNAAIINAALAATPDNGTLYLPGGTIYYGAPLNADGKKIKIRGQMSSLSVGTKLVRTGDFVGLSWCGTAGNFIQIGGIDDVEMGSSSTAYTSDMIVSRYATTGSWTNFIINSSHAGGGFVMGNGFQDHNFYRMMIRGCGSATRGQLHMEPPDTVDGNLNTNDNRFFGCHFEHNGGNYGIQVYIDYTSGAGRNNSNLFFGCKFETQPSANPIVKIVNGSRNQFLAGCRFTHYTKAFSVTASEMLRIEGFAYSTVNPTAFGDFTDVDVFSGEVAGPNVGAANLLGSTSRCDFKVISQAQYQQTPGATVTLSPDVASSAGKFGRLYLRYFADKTSNNSLVVDAAEYGGCAIKGGSTDFGQVIRIPATHKSRQRDGLTFWYRAKSTVTKNYEVRARGSGLDVIVVTQSIGTGYAWFKASFTPDQCSNLAFSIQINNSSGMGSDYLTISEWYLEDWAYSSAAPTSGTWEVGAFVRNDTPTAGGTFGWCCTTAGTPGTWKASSLAA